MEKNHNIPTEHGKLPCFEIIIIIIITLSLLVLLLI